MNSGDEILNNILSKNNYFLTRPRKQLFSLLQGNPPLSVNQISAKLTTQDQASIYRNIKLFETLGIIKRIGWGNKSKFELSDLFQRHHHHLICMQCHKIMDLHDESAIELSIALVASHRGFVPLDHQLEIRGYCQKCSHRINDSIN